MWVLEQMERELCEHMGFGNRHSVVGKDYLDWCDYFKVDELDFDDFSNLDAPPPPPAGPRSGQIGHITAAVPATGAGLWF